MALGQKLEKQRALGHCTVHTFLAASTLHTLHYSSVAVLEPPFVKRGKRGKKLTSKKGTGKKHA